MNTRILHCGDSIENYHICINEKVVGFKKRTASIGDIVYLAVKIDGVALCGARGTIAEVTDYRPWFEGGIYLQSFLLSNVEYCDPFELKELASAGGKHWSLKYVQASKPIKDVEAVKILEELFKANRTKDLNAFNKTTTEDKDIELESEKVNKELNDFNESDEEISIMGTFMTINFQNEQDKIKGLEPLVNNNFYNLFEEFDKERSLLLSDNRIFSTSRMSDENTNKNISGVSGIPDALLISYSKLHKGNPIQINLIEYECYGEGKSKTVDKFNYLNGHIIPQLMRFASAFSVVTDSRLRDKTIRSWVDKIISQVYDNEAYADKVYGWIKDLKPDISEHQISLELHNLLMSAFNSHLRIMLIIDELTSEQKETIKNVINSFKLGSDKSIDFLGYVVRLEQRINVFDEDAEYALSIQK
ncbi:hypothetical protein ACI2JA_03480 [Alkalihalobacillus sp. NPDC078783]